jgi:glycosyltransferase involved in cell wall biosynthesis
MRIAIAHTLVPFVRGGAEILVDALKEQLQIHGHDVILHRLPFPLSFNAPLVTSIEAARMLCFDEYERVIALKFPAYCIRHHNKVIWLQHQFRQVYELWGEEFGLQPSLESESLRRIIQTVDNEDIPRSRHIYTIYQEVSTRLIRFNGIPSTVLMQPSKEPELYYWEGTGNYIYYPSRITPLKRQHLAIEAMRYTKSGVRLVVTGVSEDRQYFNQLIRTIREGHLEDRVELRNHWISDEEKRKLYANALGVLYIPYQEDSCGLVSMEAFYSAKPVISCTDSGGTRELIEDGISGYMVQPTAHGLAEAMDRLFDDMSLAEHMGRDGFDDIVSRDYTWPTTIRRLLD